MQIISERTLRRIDRAVENGKIIPFLALATLAIALIAGVAANVLAPARLRQPRRCALVVRADRDDRRLRRRRAGVDRRPPHRRLRDGLRRGVGVADQPRSSRHRSSRTSSGESGGELERYQELARRTRAHRAAARRDGSNSVAIVQADQHAAADDEGGAGDETHADALRRAENDRRQGTPQSDSVATSGETTVTRPW